MTQNLNHYEKILSRTHSNYLAQISIEMTDANNQINEVLSKLTALGTILIPMNLITGKQYLPVSLRANIKKEQRYLGHERSRAGSRHPRLWLVRIHRCSTHHDRSRRRVLNIQTHDSIGQAEFLVLPLTLLSFIDENIRRVSGMNIYIYIKSPPLVVKHARDLLYYATYKTSPFPTFPSCRDACIVFGRRNSLPNNKTKVRTIEEYTLTY